MKEEVWHSADPKHNHDRGVRLIGFSARRGQRVLGSRLIWITHESPVSMVTAWSSSGSTVSGNRNQVTVFFMFFS